MSDLSYEQMISHAHDWIEAWNRHDVDSVVSVYSEDGCFVSALAMDYVGSTVVRGKANLRKYWQSALSDRPDLKFELISPVCDPIKQIVVVHYVARVAGKRKFACEIMRFEDGRQVYGEALYGVPTE